MNIIRKLAANSGEGLEFVLSDATVDRIGDIVEPAGWEYRDFLQNPIALFGHSNDFPIGTWSDIRVEGGKLLAKLNLAARGTSARIDEMIGLVEQGILRAVSVGFMPNKSEPIEKGGRRYLQQTLLEASLVSVPANPSALAVAKQLNISNEVISLAFGEQAETRRGDLFTIGKHAVMTPNGNRTMTLTPSQRIEHTQADLNDKRDHLAALNNDEVFDVDAADKLNGEIDDLTRALSVMKAAETRMGQTAQNSTALTAYTPPTSNLKVVNPIPAPAINRKPLGQKDINGLDLLGRVGAIAVVSHNMRIAPEALMEKLFPSDEVTKAAFDMTTKAASAAALTGTTGWAAELVASVLAPITPTLMVQGVYGPLSGMGMRLTFGTAGTINIPVRSLTTTIAGSFVAEGAPIPVRQGLFTTQPLVKKKMAVISTWSREMGESSVPQMSGLIREAIQQDTSVSLDTILLDATAKSAIRPAGIRNGISGQTPTAGGGFTAFIADAKLLIGAVMTATNNNIRNGCWIMNPAQRLSLIAMQPSAVTPLFPFASQVENNTLLGYPIIVSGTCPATQVIFLDAADFVSATDDNPRFEVSDVATLHMEDTTPLNIGTVGSPATVAAPSQSMFQTDCVALRMVLPMDWLLRRAALAWVTAATW